LQRDGKKEKLLGTEVLARPTLDKELPNYSFNVMRQIFDENVLDGKVDHQIIRSALRPCSEVKSMCVTWLEKHFEATGDISPHSEFVKVDVNFKKTLFEEYKAHCLGNKQKHVGYNSFCELWCVLFPYCVSRPWCNVPGKCDTCYEIQKGRSDPRYRDLYTQTMFNKLHAIHRGGMFNIERAKYKERALEAISQTKGKETTMSLIIDGMDQSHCHVPYLGNANSFSDPLVQHITAIKEHGWGVRIFRTLGTVDKGADLTIYCILRQIEDWKKRHNDRYPEKIYVQVDGGSENANIYMLSMLELLVSKRISREIIFSRLPVGHTHEDIDGVFGVIWNSLRDIPVLTLDAYEEACIKAFKNDGLNVKVETPMIIPDYQRYFDRVLDKHLSKLHKEIQTQHKWRFEAVTPTTMFPMGCKTTFKAYSSDIVVEIRKIPPAQAVTPIGKITGESILQIKSRHNLNNNNNL
jgi:hypothetical protein